MKIVLVGPFKSRLPVYGYGGTQRDVYWLAKALSEAGHEVTVLAPKGSYVNEQVHIIATPPGFSAEAIPEYLPPDFDLVNLHVKPPREPDYPYLHSQHGNAQPGEWLPANSSFVSARHAANHGGRHYVYNGLDLEEYPFVEQPENYFSFLARITLKRKNLRQAIRIVKRTGQKLKIGGGRRLSLNRRIQYLGMVGGQQKLRLLGKARGLIFPTAWEEPMGLNVIESMACGTPCIVSDRGAMPELVDGQTGFVCRSDEEYIEAVYAIDRIQRRACRERVEQHFSKEKMAQGYLELYRKILSHPRGALHEDLDINAQPNRGNGEEIPAPAKRSKRPGFSFSQPKN